MKKSIILSLFLIFVLPNITYADKSFRCGGNLIFPGDSKIIVLEACGEPFYTSTCGVVKKTLYKKGVPVKAFLQIEKWYYKQGRAIRVLTFHGDILDSIETEYTSSFSRFFKLHERCGLGRTMQRANLSKRARNKLNRCAFKALALLTAVK